MEKTREVWARRAGAGAVLAGLALRLSPWRTVFSPAGTLYVDVDDWHHLRRILTAARDWPFLPALDRYFAHPAGFVTNWPPLYDWLVGTLVRAAWLAFPGAETAARAAALVPPLAGAAALLVFWRLARRVLGETGAAAASVVAAVLPLGVFYTVLGRPDHHCVENLWVLLAAGFLLDLVEGRAGARAAWAAAACLAAGTLCWVGTAYFDVAFFAWLAWETADGASPRRTGAWTWAFAGQVPLLLAVTGGNAFVCAGRFDFDAPSLFQPALAAVLALALEALRRRARGWDRIGLACAAAGAAGAAALAWLSLPSLALFAGAPPRVFALMSELQPLLAPYGRLDLRAAEPYFGWALWLVPLLAWDFARRRTPGSRLTLVWTAALGLLALEQMRYAYHFGFPLAMLIGGALERARGTRRGGAALAAAAALAAVLLWPALRDAAALPFAGRALVGDPALREACAWIRTSTPPTRSRDRDEGTPEYGVFSDPALGPAVAALAERPAAAAENHAMRESLGWSVRLFLRADAGEVRDELASRGFRYVLVGAQSADLSGAYRALAGLPPGGAPPALWRLARADVRAPDLRRNFRLLHETPGGAFRVFELAPQSRKSVEGSDGKRV